jgi:hypothetical protein
MNSFNLVFLFGASLLFGAFMFYMGNVMVSMIGLASKQVADGLCKTLFVIFGAVGCLVFTVSACGSKEAGLAVFVEMACVLAGLALGFRHAYVNTRRAIGDEMRTLTAMTEWATLNFVRLDLNGDGQICALDMANFSATADLSALDCEMVAKLSGSLNDIGHDLVVRAPQPNSASGSVFPAIPKVISLTDLESYVERKTALWSGWLN